MIEKVSKILFRYRRIWKGEMVFYNATVFLHKSLHWCTLVVSALGIEVLDFSSLSRVPETSLTTVWRHGCKCFTTKGFGILLQEVAFWQNQGFEIFHGLLTAFEGVRIFHQFRKYVDYVHWHAAGKYQGLSSILKLMPLFIRVLSINLRDKKGFLLFTIHLIMMILLALRPTCTYAKFNFTQCLLEFNVIHSIV